MAVDLLLFASPLLIGRIMAQIKWGRTTLNMPFPGTPLFSLLRLTSAYLGKGINFEGFSKEERA
jgi:hypothetical protein